VSVSYSGRSSEYECIRTVKIYEQRTRQYEYFYVRMLYTVALSTVYDTKMSNEYYWVIESASMTAWQLASADSRQKS